MTMNSTVICLEAKLVCRWVRVISIGYVGLISIWRLVSVQSIICSLTFVIYDGASFLAFMFGVVVLHREVSDIIICYVSLISFRRLIPLETVISLLTFLFYYVAFFLAFLFRVLLIRRWVIA